MRISEHTSHCGGWQGDLSNTPGGWSPHAGQHHGIGSPTRPSPPHIAFRRVPWVNLIAHPQGEVWRGLLGPHTTVSQSPQTRPSQPRFSPSSILPSGPVGSVPAGQLHLLRNAYQPAARPSEHRGWLGPVRGHQLPGVTPPRNETSSAQANPATPPPAGENGDPPSHPPQ